MKKPFRLLPVVCSVPVLFGCSSMADKSPPPDMATRIEPMQRVRHSASYANDYYQLGRYYQGQDRLDKAAEAYIKALEIHSDYVDAQNALGTVYSKQGKYDEAVAVFNSILKTKPQVAKVYNNLGYTYFLQGKHGEAIVAFEKALKLEPGNQRTHNNIGAAYRKSGNEDSALIAFARAAELSSPQLAAKKTAAPASAVASIDASVTASATSAPSSASKPEPAAPLAAMATTTNLAAPAAVAAISETKTPVTPASSDTPRVVNLQPEIVRSVTLQPHGITAVAAVAETKNVTTADRVPAPVQVATVEAPRIVNLHAQADINVTLHPYGTTTINVATPHMLALSPAQFFESTPLAKLIPESTLLGDSLMVLASSITTADRNDPDNQQPASSAATIPAAPVPESGTGKQADKPEPMLKPDERQTESGYQLEIANGNGITGMARRTRAMLAEQGLPHARLTNSKPYRQKQTVIHYRAGYHDQALALSQKLARKAVLRQDENLRRGTDIKLILGKDMAMKVTLSDNDTKQAPLAINNMDNMQIDS
ncbi:MAG: hypothetical protein H6R04_1252 [Burkholderiaceae bacterium]|nr:hypothetical protein [Burkholderiaceae bacterium]